MTTHAYSPDTGELIRTDTPAEWMGVTSIAPPDFDPTTAGCFFRNGAWGIVVSTAIAEAHAKEKLEVLAQTRVLRETALNRLTGIQLNTNDAPTVAAIQAARSALLNITSDVGVIAATDGSSTKAAIMAAWRSIASALATAAPSTASVFVGLGM